MQRDLVSGIFRNVQAVVNRIGGARWNQVDVNHGARGPGVALVDGIAVAIDLQRAVKVRALFHRTVAVVFDHAAPENGLALLVGSLQFEPGVVGIDGAAGKKVADLFRADNHVDAHGITTADNGLHPAERRGDGSNLRSRPRE